MNNNAYTALMTARERLKFALLMLEAGTPAHTGMTNALCILEALKDAERPMLKSVQQWRTLLQSEEEDVDVILTFTDNVNMDYAQELLPCYGFQVEKTGETTLHVTRTWVY